MVLLARTRPGDILDSRLTQCLMRHLNLLRLKTPVLVDGFPSCPDHLATLDAGCALIEVVVNESTRIARLNYRSENTARLWRPGAPSLRDSLVKETIDAATTNKMPVEQISNDGTSVSAAVNSLANCLSKY